MKSISAYSSGYHFPWQIGVGLYLQGNHDYSNCCFAGVSAGFYVAILLATDFSVTDYVNKLMPQAYIIFKASRTGTYFIGHGVIK